MAILKREEVVDDWSVLIGGAQGKADEVFRGTQELMTVQRCRTLRLRKSRCPLG